MANATLHEVLEQSRSLGFLGPGPVDDQIVHAAAFVALFAGDERARVLDLGSGGGLPGLVLADALPTIALTLLDANARRVAFLRSAVRQLGCADRVTVVEGRAEERARDPHLREQFRIVVARSFGAPAVTAECAAGFLEEQGRLLISEPKGVTDRWPEEGLAGLGLEVGALHTESAVASVRELRRSRAGLDTVPRALGVPTRRPLF